MSLDRYIEGFDEEPGYLDYGRFGPLSRVVLEEGNVFADFLRRARHGSLDVLDDQDLRLREAVAALTGFDVERIGFQPNTTSGLLHAMFGLTGQVLLSPDEFPSLPISAVRAQEALHTVQPAWLATDHGRVTPGTVREQLADNTVAVAVSLVDARTGYLADLEGIRQVIGDRLLIVDAIQGFGVVDVPWEHADVIASGGQKWCRAGWGTGFLALSERAEELLVPVFSGYTGTDADEVWGEVPPPASGARAYRTSSPDPIAESRLAAALEEIAEVGVAEIQASIARRVSDVIDLADDFAVPLASSRDERERAGIVVLEPEPERLSALTAALHNHGVTATTRLGTVRLSIHAGTNEETLDMLRAALVSFSTTGF
ncbi:aminotransferase class V-fold PLP-dependent enzyme [Agromyces sp. SYSU T00194]|uniref:aminotransferase class V-fold PLP-dependent enzyme n=1 Tax=Agromyces chitinivorans TaxID=3158560 RepID=UPI00339A4B44